eukprot:4215073-Pleurochrysis_carterae.AAC.1
MARLVIYLVRDSLFVWPLLGFDPRAAMVLLESRDLVTRLATPGHVLQMFRVFSVCRAVGPVRLHVACYLLCSPLACLLFYVSGVFTVPWLTECVQVSLRSRDLLLRLTICDQALRVVSVFYACREI